MTKFFMSGLLQIYCVQVRVTSFMVGFKSFRIESLIMPFKFQLHFLKWGSQQDVELQLECEIKVVELKVTTIQTIEHWFIGW